MADVNALVLLVLAWAVLLLPGALRSRGRSPRSTVGGFERAMSVLRGDEGGVVVVPGSPAARAAAHVAERRRVLQRRRAWFLRLAGMTVATGVLAVLTGGWAWGVFVATAGATVVYTAVLRRLKVQHDEARRTVGPLIGRRPGRGSDGRPLTLEDESLARVGGGVRLRPWSL